MKGQTGSTFIPCNCNNLQANPTCAEIVYKLKLYVLALWASPSFYPKAAVSQKIPTVVWQMKMDINAQERKGKQI